MEDRYGIRGGMIYIIYSMYVYVNGTYRDRATRLEMPGSEINQKPMVRACYSRYLTKN